MSPLDLARPYLASGAPTRRSARPTLSSGALLPSVSVIPGFQPPHGTFGGIHSKSVLDRGYRSCTAAALPRCNDPGKYAFCEILPLPLNQLDTRRPVFTSSRSHPEEYAIRFTRQTGPD